MARIRGAGLLPALGGAFGGGGLPAGGLGVALAAGLGHHAAVPLALGGRQGLALGRPGVRLAGLP